jgi:hypothetical protein
MPGGLLISIPANALSDEECLHYAALEPSAAAELTRRLTAQTIDPCAEQDELQESMRRIESEADELSGLQDRAKDACMRNFGRRKTFAPLTLAICRSGSTI